ncbi:hypothetical protein CDD81_992 [Ophiocordyceps australis]|uniref:Uncharacterized protein n=1 Tax=Ophiocordyceps australis TaxID=1399860 RepID=A0A2C5XWZ5_9HYPO|nr:hypothetical protein CDD81_992 [Ophiocordyceps australis]
MPQVDMLEFVKSRHRRQAPAPPDIYDDSPPLNELLDMIKKGAGRIGNSGGDFRAYEMFPLSGGQPFTNLPGMLHELRHHSFKSKNGGETTKVGVEHEPGHPLGPQKKPQALVPWASLEGQKRIDAMWERSNDMISQLKHFWKMLKQYPSVYHTHLLAARATADTQEITMIAAEIASIIDSKSSFKSSHFNPIWTSVYDSRRLSASVMAQEAVESVKSYVLEPWEARSRLAAMDVNLERDCSNALDAATKVTKVAKRLGNTVLDKSSRLDMIDRALQEGKGKPESEDIKVAVADSGTIYMSSKETMEEALRRERSILSLELDTMQDAVYTLLQGALVVRRESNTGQVVAAQSQSAEESIKSQQVLDEEAREWRTQQLQALEALVEQDAQTHKELERIRLGMDTLRRNHQANQDQDLSKLEREVQFQTHMGVMLLKLAGHAVPITRVLTWSRHTTRVISRLVRARQALRARGKAKDPIAEQAMEVERKLDKIVRETKLAVPDNFRDWASTKSPRQIVSRLEAMQKSDIEPNAQLDEVLNELVDTYIGLPADSDLLPDLPDVPTEEPEAQPRPFRKQRQWSIKRMMKQMSLFYTPLRTLESPGSPVSAQWMGFEDQMREGGGSSDYDFWLLLEGNEMMQQQDDYVQPETLRDAVLEEAEMRFGQAVQAAMADEAYAEYAAESA